MEGRDFSSSSFESHFGQSQLEVLRNQLAGLDSKDLFSLEMRISLQRKKAF